MKKLVLLVSLMLAVAFTAYSAEKADKPTPKQDQQQEVTVLFVNGETLQLKSIEIGSEEDGMLGKSFKRFRRLPVAVGNITMEVPIENLSKIEITGVDKDGMAINVKLTAKDGKSVEGVTRSEGKIIWRGTVAFADSTVTLDPKMVKEINLK